MEDTLIWRDNFKVPDTPYDAIGSRCALRRGAIAPQPPRPKARGWKRNARPECPVSGATGLCSVCIRSGFDLRRIFCPWDR